MKIQICFCLSPMKGNYYWKINTYHWVQINKIQEYIWCWRITDNWNLEDENFTNIIWLNMNFPHMKTIQSFQEYSDNTPKICSFNGDIKLPFWRELSLRDYVYLLIILYCKLSKIANFSLLENPCAVRLLHNEDWICTFLLWNPIIRYHQVPRWNSFRWWGYFLGLISHSFKDLRTEYYDVTWKFVVIAHVIGISEFCWVVICWSWIETILSQILDVTISTMSDVSSIGNWGNSRRNVEFSATNFEIVRNLTINHICMLCCISMR